MQLEYITRHMKVKHHLLNHNKHDVFNMKLNLSLIWVSTRVWSGHKKLENLVPLGQRLQAISTVCWQS